MISSRPLYYPTAVVAAWFVLLSVVPAIEAGNTWDGGGADANWGTGDNWFSNGAPGYGTLIFSGNTRTTNNNNSITSMNQVNWNDAAAWVTNGTSTLSLFDNSGTQAKLESLGSGGVTINAPITFAANNPGPPNPFGEINAVGSNIIFASGTLTVDGSSVNGIKFFGGAGKDVTFASAVSANGKWMGFTNENGSSVTIATGASVTMGDFYVMNGNTLKLAGGTLTTSAVRLGGDFGNTGNPVNAGLGGTLAFTPAAGGVSFGSMINTVTGNTSNALLIDSQNTSGSNTLTGSLFLDSDLRVQTASGGTLAVTTGASDIKGRKLTIDGTGTTSISQVLASSFSAGGMLVKSGNGTLILSNTSNTYTGTNNATLNANGTTINGGVLGIQGDGSLGLVPAGAYNNIQFTGSATLQDTANNITLNANRNISVVSGATATIDSNGNSFQINGIINGSGGAVAKSGAGNLTLTGANTYSGKTTISAGTLLLNGTTSANTITSTGGTASGGTPALQAASSDVQITAGTLQLGKANQIIDTAKIAFSGGKLDSAGFSEGNRATAGVGALTLSADSIIDFGSTVASNTFIHFAASNGQSWTGNLDIYNWTGSMAGNGTDQLIFGTDNTSLTSGQLGSIRFFSGANTGFLGTGVFTNAGVGELVPVPEPTTLFGALGLLGLMGYRERRRLFGRGLSTRLDRASA